MEHVEEGEWEGIARMEELRQCEIPIEIQAFTLNTKNMTGSQSQMDSIQWRSAVSQGRF